MNNRMGEIDYFVFPGEVFKHSFSVFVEGGLESEFTGEVSILLSKDKIWNEDDLLLNTIAGQISLFGAEITEIKIDAAPGEYFLITRIMDYDEDKFEVKEPELVQSFVINEIDLTLTNVQVHDYEVSEYNFSTGYQFNLNIDFGCCFNSEDKFSSQLEVYIGPHNELNDSSVYLETKYVDFSQLNKRSTQTYTGELYNRLPKDGANYFLVQFKGYYEEGFHEINPKVIAIPISLISTAGDYNKSNLDKYPYLTFTDFQIDPTELEGQNTDTLLFHASQFFGFIEKAMMAGIDGRLIEMLNQTDLAFAYAGNHKLSTVLYARTHVISDLYAQIYETLSSDGFKEMTQEEFGNRLEKSLEMEELVEQGYATLSEAIIPENIQIQNEVERSGFYSDNEFENPIISLNPILWEDATLPYLEAAMRKLNFELADKMIFQIDRYENLYYRVWNLLPEFQEKMGQEILSGSLIEYTELLDYLLLKLKFYTDTGQYEKGQFVYNRLIFLQEMSFGYQKIDVFISAGRFFENFGEFERADSLFRIADLEAGIEADEATSKGLKASRNLQGHNANILDIKLSGQKPLESEYKTFFKEYSTFQKEQFVLDVMEVNANPFFAEKVGHLLYDRYFDLYRLNIDLLIEQNQWILANQWMKNLAFFLGRDGYVNESLSLYEDLFLFENLKMRAFRNSFSEEAQIFYGKKQLDDFGRYLNLLLSGDKSKWSDSTTIARSIYAFDKAMEYHSFIMRGNYLLTIKVLESEEEDILRKYEVWKAYKDLLNQQFLEDEHNDEQIRKIKDELEESEKYLIRSTRDTSIMNLFGREVKNFEEIRSSLKPGEVAIEILRIVENDKIYHGSHPIYAAFIITPDLEIPRLIRMEIDGQDMEDRYLTYYRSAIKYKLSDTLSYRNYWADIADHLPLSTKKIYFVPDGVYHLINIPSLFNPATNQYVFDQYSIELFPSLSFMGEKELSNLKSAALFGYPEYIDEPSNLIPDSAFRTTRGNLLNREIIQLPGTKKEVDEIDEILSGNGISVSLFTGKEATKQNFYDYAEADILHLATHGYWIDKEEKKPVASIYRSLSNSGLLLSGAQTRINEPNQKYRLNRSGLLTAAEIQNMVLFQTELVVLSACETGLGEVVPGEGIFGLKRAFQKAGAKNLITSLWKVDDEATQQFMRYFYSGIKENSIQVSFEEAVENLRKNFPEPYYWGAFTLMRLR